MVEGPRPHSFNLSDEPAPLMSPLGEEGSDVLRRQIEANERSATALERIASILERIANNLDPSGGL